MAILTALDNASTESFDTLASSGSSAALPQGWAISESGTSATNNGLYAAGTGASNAGDTYSFGAAGSTDRALGGLLSGSLSPTFGSSYTNATGAAIAALDIAFTGEQWRLGAANRGADRLDFQISFDATSLTSGTWIDIDSLDFSSLVTSGATGALDGNANSAEVAATIDVGSLVSGGIAAGATFWIRWSDYNASSSDDGLAVDDFSLTARGEVAPAPGQLSIAESSVVEGDSGSSAIEFVVTRLGGSTGAVSATWTATLPGGAAGADAGDLAAGQVLTGTVSFADGETSATVVLQVAGDTLFEADESFTVTLSDAQGGATFGTASATGTIVNDDAAPPAALANVWVNEIHYDNAGTDADEQVEIAGTAGTSLAGYSLVFYNGGTDGADAGAATAYRTVPLSGVIDDEGAGYGAVTFLLPANAIQNGPNDGVALVGPGGEVVEFLSYEGPITASGGAADGLTSTDIGVAQTGSDLAGLSLQRTGEGSSGEDFTWTGPVEQSLDTLNAGQSFLDPNGVGQVSIRDASVAEGDSGTSDLVFTVRRAGGLAQAGSVDYSVVLDGTADAGDLAADAVLSGTVDFAVGQVSATVRVAVAGDTIGEGNETLSVTLSNPSPSLTIADGTATGTIVNDDPVALAIYEIQGAGHRSDYEGQIVSTIGIVTAVDSNGFYMQDAGGDGDFATSDGIFVFTGSAPGADIAVGNLVSVSATVTEYEGSAAALPLTELTAPTVALLSTGNALPAATLIGTGGILPPSQVIDDDGFGTFDPLTDGIDFWEAMEGMLVTIEAPQVVANTNNFGETDVVASWGAGATGVNGRGGITVSDGDFNPEKIQIDDDAAIYAGFAPDYTTGDRLGDVTGVLNYAFNFYEVLVTQPVATVVDTTLARETTALDGDATHLTLATYNLENLSAAEESADGSPDRFDVLAADIVYNLQAPDILAVQEIQDADGQGSGAELSGQATADALIRAIADAGGPGYVYVEVTPEAAGSTGGAPGANIRNGYLYNPDRVSLVEDSVALITDPAFNGSRKPLVASFEFNGETFTAINVHFTSRGGSDPLWGETQPPANGGEGARMAQSAAVLAYVNDQLATDPDGQFAMLGDFNGFYFEPFQRQLTEGGVFTNAAEALLPAEERYSYLFEGNSQLLDNILLTGGLLEGAAYDSVHINAEFGEEAQATDHDPQIVRIAFNSAPTALVLSDAAVAENEPAGTVVGTLTGTDAPGDVLTYSLLDDAGGLFAVDAATGEIRTTQPLDHEAAASYGIVAQVTDQGGRSFSQAFAISVEDANDAPTASDDTASAREDGRTGNLWTALLANDTDQDEGAVLTISAVDTSETLGSVTFDAAQQRLVYHADADAFDYLAPGATLTDSFTYTIVDQNGATDTATVSVTVTGTHDGVKLNGGWLPLLVGGNGEDWLAGGKGLDLILARGGHDMLFGGQGADALHGGDGNDLLVGEQGIDLLYGGGGRDAFAFGKSGGADLVFDFDTTQDRIELYDGIKLASSRAVDIDRDGERDLILSFTKGGGSVTLFGVSDIRSVEIHSTSQGLSSDYREAGYAFVNGQMLPTLVDWPSDLVIL